MIFCGKFYQLTTDTLAKAPVEDESVAHSTGKMLAVDRHSKELAEDLSTFSPAAQSVGSP